MAAGRIEMPREKRDDVAVKIEAALYRKAKVVAAYRGITIAKYLSELLRKPVERDHEKMVQEMQGGAE